MALASLFAARPLRFARGDAMPNHANSADAKGRAADLPR